MQRRQVGANAGVHRTRCKGHHDQTSDDTHELLLYVAEVGTPR